MNKNVIHVISGLGDGGAEAVLYRLVTSDNSGLKHIIVSLSQDGKYIKLFESCGIQVYCLNMRGLKGIFLSIIRLFRILKIINPAVVQTWMYHANLIGGAISRISGVKNIFWGIHHSAIKYSELKFLTFIFVRINSFLSKYIPAGIIYCASSSKLVHESIGHKNVNSYVVPNGYDLKKFKFSVDNKNYYRSLWGLEPDTILIGMVARFDPLKDHYCLLEALSLVKDLDIRFKCILVGNGVNNQNHQLVKWINYFGLTGYVSLLGQQSDVPGIMSALDLHVLSSSAEAFPNVLAEAMACETPCVTTNVGDASFIVGGMGWVVAPKDPKTLCQGILSGIQAMKSQPEFNQLRLNARRHIERNFSIASMTLSYLQIWQGVDPNMKDLFDRLHE